MSDLLKKLELKHVDFLIRERMLRNSDTCHPLIAHNLEQIRSQIKSLQIQIDMMTFCAPLRMSTTEKGTIQVQQNKLKLLGHNLPVLLNRLAHNDDIRMD